MKPRFLLLAFVLAALPVAGQSAPAGQLPRVTLHVGKAELKTEIASTPAEEERGLMFRPRLGDNEGMIFLLQPAPQTAEFWMKNTLIPLSVAFIGKDGTILEIHDMQPGDPTAPDEQLPRTRSDSNQVCYALEANLHWFSLNGVKAGDKITPPPATLKH
jgi:uncharacterized membrane protein (UPF0127 family)